MTMTIAAVRYSSVESKPENTLAKSAKYPAGPVTYTPSPPASACAMDRSSLILGPSCSQPLPFSATLIGTTTWSALPSLAGTGPRTLPLTSLTPAKRLTSAATLAWSAAVTGPLRSYTTSAGKTSLGVNFLASSTTWVDSAFFGSQADASFFWALLSLPASGPAAANTTTQKTSTTHLLQRPHGRLAILRGPSMTPPGPQPSPFTRSVTICRDDELVKTYRVTPDLELRRCSPSTALRSPCGWSREGCASTLATSSKADP